MFSSNFMPEKTDCNYFFSIQVRLSSSQVINQNCPSKLNLCKIYAFVEPYYYLYFFKAPYFFSLFSLLLSSL